MNRELFEKRKNLICELVQDEMYVPMKEKEMAAFMQVAKEDREEFRKVLDELLKESKISITSKKYEARCEYRNWSFYQQCQRLRLWK